ncbi:DUF366 family protein [Desulfosporosinus sp. BICA1-9]|uniref:DUF366 family protein n=1 Tax=Desulfosporosinus sp. BICA1-9 TaxID=1531958 RepID=UPI00054B599F|nr:DUF366 family protein [Desulfosporosinus sp. BICA1-9]KJS49076.1 MAG: hypothetical protein VR66_10455 [Peptococcaceae bacterium BRH_c23]KJS88890.1 MAG: hypothetical protein JL57_10170 [Desulfosporosinus sp. BICA1-9]HBW36687.1 DUF366 domain-containing protein [Desulfosporosinus sp.]
MKYTVLRTPLNYDGSQLQSLFAYKNFGLMGDSMSVFRGSCRVEQDEMVDMEDVLAKDWIYSEDMLHFIVEHFEMDLEKTIIRQRLLIATIKEELERLGVRTLSRSGDDLYEADKKLSVSISTLSPVSTLIHCGLNVSNLNTPIPTVGLADLKIQDVLGFGESVAKQYCAEVGSMRLARCKVRGVS